MRSWDAVEGRSIGRIDAGARGPTCALFDVIHGIRQGGLE